MPTESPEAKRRETDHITMGRTFRAYGELVEYINDKIQAEISVLESANVDGFLRAQGRLQGLRSVQRYLRSNNPELEQESPVVFPTDRGVGPDEGQPADAVPG